MFEQICCYIKIKLRVSSPKKWFLLIDESMVHILLNFSPFHFYLLIYCRGNVTFKLQIVGLEEIMKVILQSSIISLFASKVK